MRPKLLISLGLLVASCFSASAIAQVLEEILVTAQKREQNLQDVGISVSAFSGQQLAELGMLSVSDIVAQTPNVTFVSPFGEGNNIAFTLRGVGLNDFSEHNEAPGAVYVDGVYQGTLAGANFQLFDLDRVEVLRGPQGTLFGRNTSAGLVQYITRKPGDEPEARAELTVGEFSQTRFEGAVGGPLGDVVAGRLSALYHKHDGYRPSRTPGVDDAKRHRRTCRARSAQDGLRRTVSTCCLAPTTRRQIKLRIRTSTLNDLPRRWLYGGLCLSTRSIRFVRSRTAHRAWTGLLRLP